MVESGTQSSGGSDGFLREMAEASLRRCEEAGRRRSWAELAVAATGAPPVRPLRLDRFDLIAEVKRSSPSEGALRREVAGEDGFILDMAGAYEAAGAAMISVLTEPSRFGGSLDDLRRVSERVSIPVMRKDFLVDPYQIVEARACGASAVLVILRMLPGDALERMVATSQEWGMHLLLEAFDEEELGIAARLCESLRGAGNAGACVLVGLNCRDLATLRIEPGRFAALCGAMPRCAVRIAESGVYTADDAAELAAMGYDGALVGTALMKAVDPEELARRMILAGRDAVRKRGGRE